MRLTYSNITSTIAVAVALSGGAVATASALITGAEVKDGSLSGLDIRNESLSGLDIKDGSLASSAFSLAARANLRGATGAAGATGAKGETGATGPQGAAGLGVVVTTASGPDVTGYVDLTTLATQAFPTGADYVLFARLTAHNTGATDDYLNCFLVANGSTFGGGGANITAGSTVTINAIGAVSLPAPTTATLSCQSNGVTTFDLANITIRSHNLG